VKEIDRVGVASCLCARLSSKQLYQLRRGVSRPAPLIAFKCRRRVPVKIDLNQRSLAPTTITEVVQGVGLLSDLVPREVTLVRTRRLIDGPGTTPNPNDHQHEDNNNQRGIQQHGLTHV
jgi:hypothetical protein